MASSRAHALALIFGLSAACASPPPPAPAPAPPPPPPDPIAACEPVSWARDVRGAELDCDGVRVSWEDRPGEGRALIAGLDEALLRAHEDRYAREEAGLARGDQMAPGIRYRIRVESAGLGAIGPQIDGRIVALPEPDGSTRVLHCSGQGAAAKERCDALLGALALRLPQRLIPPPAASAPMIANKALAAPPECEAMARSIVCEEAMARWSEFSATGRAAARDAWREAAATIAGGAEASGERACAIAGVKARCEVRAVRAGGERVGALWSGSVVIDGAEWGALCAWTGSEEPPAACAGVVEAL